MCEKVTGRAGADGVDGATGQPGQPVSTTKFCLPCLVREEFIPNSWKILY